MAKIAKIRSNEGSLDVRITLKHSYNELETAQAYDSSCLRLTDDDNKVEFMVALKKENSVERDVVTIAPRGDLEKPVEFVVSGANTKLQEASFLAVITKLNKVEAQVTKVLKEVNEATIEEV